jgi:hypothetical protein
MASGAARSVRRAAPLGGSYLTSAVSASSFERCQVWTRQLRASDRQKFPSEEIFEAREP